MKAVNIVKYGRSPTVATLPLPTHSPSQYLIKMAFAPINPSDLNFYLGHYGIKKQGFVVMGFEGSGTILTGPHSNQIGNRVSVLSNKTNGTHATHLIAEKDDLIIWPRDTKHSLQALSMACINPLSVIGLAQTVIDHAATNVVLSAAASNLNKMLIRYLRRQKKTENVQIYGLSRSEAFDEELVSLGVKKMLRMEQFQPLKQALNNEKTVFLDCVGGTFAGKVFNCLPNGSMMVNYGRLSKQNLNEVDLGGLYFGSKSIRGFWLNTYLSEIGRGGADGIKKEVIANGDILLQSKIRREYEIEEIGEAMRESIKDQSLGKVLLKL